MAGVTESRNYNALLTTTLANFRKKMVDNVFDVYPLLSWMNGTLGRTMKVGNNGAGSVKRLVGGGESIVEHLEYGTNSTAASYTGSGIIDTTLQDNQTIARYNWKNYAATVGIIGNDLRNNRGEAELINLLDVKQRNAIMSLRNLMSQDAYADGTRDGGNVFTGLEALVSATATAGGLAPGTFAWWKSIVTASGGSFAATGLKEMRTIFNDLTYGNDKPDAIFTTQTIFEYYESSLQPQERYSNTEAANSGFLNLTFKGIPVWFDRDCTSGNIYFLNSKYVNLVVNNQADFTIRPFVEPENQDLTTAKIIFQGNMTTNNRRMLGKITGVGA